MDGVDARMDGRVEGRMDGRMMVLTCPFAACLHRAPTFTPPFDVVFKHNVTGIRIGIKAVQTRRTKMCISESGTPAAFATAISKSFLAIEVVIMVIF